MKLSIMYNPVPSIINETFVNKVFYIILNLRDITIKGNVKLQNFNKT